MLLFSPMMNAAGNLDSDVRFMMDGTAKNAFVAARNVLIHLGEQVLTRYSRAELRINLAPRQTKPCSLTGNKG